MSVPAFLNSSFRYKETLAVVNVATCITDFRDEVLNQQTPAWTEPVGGTFKSPPDANGQFFNVVLSAISATRLQVKITDVFAQTISDRCIDIDAGGTSIQYFTGQMHAFINSARTTPEFAGGALVDLSPETITIPNYRTVGCGHRNSAGTVGNQSATEWFMMDNATVSTDQRVCSRDTNAGSNQAPFITITGVYVFSPMLVTTSIFGSGNDRWIGRIFQCLLCHGGIAFGSELTVPTDDGVTGVFKVVGRSSGYGSTRMCVRKA